MSGGSIPMYCSFGVVADVESRTERGCCCCLCLSQPATSRVLSRPVLAAMCQYSWCLGSVLPYPKSGKAGAFPWAMNLSIIYPALQRLLLFPTAGFCSTTGTMSWVMVGYWTALGLLLSWVDNLCPRSLLVLCLSAVSALLTYSTQNRLYVTRIDQLPPCKRLYEDCQLH